MKISQCQFYMTEPMVTGEGLREVCGDTYTHYIKKVISSSNFSSLK